MTDAPGSAPLLSVRDVTVGWRGRAVVAGVTFDLRPADWLGIVGPNGSGKSTLLRAALGLSAPLRGTIARSPVWRAGHVPQRDTLEPLFRFRAREVVEMFARVGAPSRAAAREAAADALRAVAMDHAADRVFRDLSGGQKQRILIARALAVRPTVLVLDEPTTGMDVRAEAELLQMVRRIRLDRGLAVILVSHSLHLVAEESTEVGILQDGRAVFGPPDEVLAPEVLSRIYGCPVRSVSVDGHRMIRAVVGASGADEVSA